MVIDTIVLIIGINTITRVTTTIITIITWAAHCCYILPFPATMPRPDFDVECLSSRVWSGEFSAKRNSHTTPRRR
ncbi:hypothetical protein N9L68_08860 [bacterium]|nr:hypothetical protein [bacterium]